MARQSLLQQYRQQYQPALPPILNDLHAIQPVAEKGQYVANSQAAIQELFPLTGQQPVLMFEQGPPYSVKPLKVGVILSGGQAPGGHNVIAGLLDALQKLHPDSQLIGFLDGPSGLIKNKSVVLTNRKVAPYRNQGGFDLIGSSRTKIETDEQFAAVEHTLKEHALDGLVIVGGDDSNTNAAFLAEFCQQRNLPTRIVGVPKTIDADLRNAYIDMSFGFDTASKIYSEIIGNLLKDALSAKKYYFFVKMMGRSSSHLTLECALQTQVNLALIGEEVAARQQSLADITQHIADLICERAAQDKHYGVILIPEGLLEFIPQCQKMIEELNHLLVADPHLSRLLEQETNHAMRLQAIRQRASAEIFACFSNLPEEIQKQLLLDRDPHGNIQLSKIETERLLISLVEQELLHRKQQGSYHGKFNPQPLFCGYEGRAGLPSNFDCQYCYTLGHAAALLIQHEASGYICCVKHLDQPIENWQILGVPIVDMLHFETRHAKKKAVIQKTLVDLEGPVFQAFNQRRKGWRLDDVYCCPGPIQFIGPVDLTDSRPLTLLYEKQTTVCSR